MRQKSFGFTLIELLIVAVVIGVLAAVATATFKIYFTNARDSERTAIINGASLMVKVDGASDWTNSKYEYDVVGLRKIFLQNAYRPAKSKRNICPIFGTAKGNNTYLGDDNEFIFMTWGESTSTWNLDTTGVIVNGTEQAVKNVLMANLDIADFACDKVTVLAEMAFETGLAELPTYYLGIDEDGEVFQWGEEVGESNCELVTLNNCDLLETTSGDTSGSCTGVFTGNCEYSCSDSIWTSISNTCVLVPTNCTVTTESNCDLSETASGDTDGDCEIGYTGVCEYSCTDSTWTVVSNTCTAVVTDCFTTTIDNCDLLQTTTGGTDGNCENSYLGSCLYDCTNSIWTPVNNTCTLPDPDPPVDCPSFGILECWWNSTDCVWQFEELEWWNDIFYLGSCMNR